MCVYIHSKNNTENTYSAVFNGVCTCTNETGGPRGETPRESRVNIDVGVRVHCLHALHKHIQ